MTSRRYRYISQELNKLQRGMELEWVVEPYYPNDLSKWRLYLKGRCGTPYESGNFQLSMTFPVEYPFKCPDFRFDTNIFHPSVDARGCMSLSFFSAYVATMTIRDLLDGIASAIFTPSTDEFLNTDAAFLYEQNLESFQRQAALWTIRYAIDDEIISNLSYSTSSSGIVSPEINSPNTFRTHSPCSYRWSFQLIIDLPQGLFVEQSQSYPKNEQLTLERAYRCEQSEIELGESLISLSRGIQVFENGNMYRVKRNMINKAKLRRRHKCLAFYNAQSFVEDPIITDCLSPSMNTNIAAVIAGILHEGTLKNKELEAKNLVQKLKVIDKTDTVLMGLECIKLYTGTSFLPKSLNKFLRERDHTKLDTLGPFCKLLYSQFNKYPSGVESLKVYRGENLRAHELRGYKRATGKGSYQWLGFTSTSKSETVAKLFVRNAYFIIRLEKLYNDGRALDIIKLSNFEEDEVLLRPGVEFWIDKFEYNEDSKIYTFYLVAYI